MRFYPSKYNVLPPKFESWTRFFNDCIKNKHLGNDVLKGDQIVYSYRVDESDMHQEIFIDSDFFKARVLDEMWEDLDFNTSDVMEAHHAIHSPFPLSKEIPMIKKILNLAKIRELN